MSKAASSSELIVTSFRLPFVTTRQENGSIGRTESRDEWARSLAHVVTESKGQWVGWPGSLLKRGQPIPGSDPADDSPTAALTSDQVQWKQETFKIIKTTLKKTKKRLIYLNRFDKSPITSFNLKERLHFYQNIRVFTREDQLGLTNSADPGYNENKKLHLSNYIHFPNVHR